MQPKTEKPSRKREARVTSAGMKHVSSVLSVWRPRFVMVLLMFVFYLPVITSSSYCPTLQNIPISPSPTPSSTPAGTASALQAAHAKTFLTVPQPLQTARHLQTFLLSDEHRVTMFKKTKKDKRRRSHDDTFTDRVHTEHHGMRESAHLHSFSFITDVDRHADGGTAHHLYDSCCMEKKEKKIAYACT